MTLINVNKKLGRKAWPSLACILGRGGGGRREVANSKFCGAYGLAALSEY